MRYLFIHQNMPGQYKHIVGHLAANRKNEVVFITKRKDLDLPNVKKLLYEPHREPSPQTHRYMIGAERGILHGQQVARLCIDLKTKGWRPDIIVGHPGWGEMLYVKDVWPDVPVLAFFEFYYRGHGADVGFDPQEQPSVDDLCRIRSKNFINDVALNLCDAGMSPTLWQYAQLPAEFAYKVSVIHDGIDTRTCAPDPAATLRLADGRTLTRDDEVITYCVRNFEPYRGFPTFMKAVELIHKRRPKAQVVAIGADGISYGKPLPDGKLYRHEALKEVQVDRSRLHFIGSVPYDTFLKVIKVSQAHIYLTYPFVLSWSMLESMSAGCLVIGSRTPPVEEVIVDRENGLLVDFFSPEEVADRVDEVFAAPDRMAELRQRARATVLERYDLEKCLGRQLTLIKNLVLGHRPVMPAPTFKPGQPDFARPTAGPAVGARWPLAV